MATILDQKFSYCSSMWEIKKGNNSTVLSTQISIWKPYFCSTNSASNLLSKITHHGLMLGNYIVSLTEVVQSHSSEGTKSDPNIEHFFEFMSIQQQLMVKGFCNLNHPCIISNAVQRDCRCTWSWAVLQGHFWFGTWILLSSGINPIQELIRHCFCCCCCYYYYLFCIKSHS